jgi:hypothetical protein
MTLSHPPKDRFSSDQEALDFVASRIADEAQREGAPLSQVERKMLYFSETAWTLPDIWDVNDEFVRKYQQDGYEKKISQLIKKAALRARNGGPEEYAGWSDALRRLREHDRYLLVMVKQAGLSATFGSARPHHHRWRLWAACFVVGALFSGFTWALEKLDPHSGYFSAQGVYHSRFSDTLSFSLWAFPIGLIIVYELLRLLLGAGKIDGITARGTEWIFAPRKRTK